MNTLLIALTQGIVFGITMAIIPGPIFFLIVQRTLNEGWLTGLLCGLGAVTADVTYAFIAAAGLTIISQFLLDYQPIITIIGGLFLIYLGVTTYAKHVEEAATISVERKGLLDAWFSTFLLTLTNPVTIISYTVIFAGLSVGASDPLTSFTVVVGVILGATSVVVALVALLHYFGKGISPKMLARVNKIAGILLVCFGILAIVRTLVSYA